MPDQTPPPEKKEPVVESVYVSPEQTKFKWRWSSLTKRQKIYFGVGCFFLAFILATIQFNFFDKLNHLVNGSQVSFLVQDAKSKQAIGSAVIKTKEGQLKTDSQGYAKKVLIAGKQIIKISADKYLEKTITKDLKRGEMKIEVLLERAPPTTATITGSTLSFVDKKALAGVTIELVNSQVKSSTSSAKDGSFSIKVPPGTQTLSFYLSGYKNLKKSVEARDKKTTIISADLTVAGRVVFVSNRDGDSAVYSANLDGTQVKKLILNTKGKNDDSAVVSPDHKNILFKSDREGAADEYGNPLSKLYLVDATGDSPKKISDEPLYDERWFPDSSKVVFSSKNQIKAYDLAGKSLKTLVTVPTATASSYLSFAVSPNSKLLAYADATKIYTASSDGSNSVERGDEDYSYGLSFSEDSKKLDYESYISGKLKHFQIDLETGGKREIALTEVRGRFVSREGGGFYNFDGIPSSDGNTIAYVSYRDGKNDLFIAKKDLSGETRLTTSGGVVNAFFTSRSDYLIFHLQKEQESSVNIISTKGGTVFKIADITSFAGLVD